MASLRAVYRRFHHPMRRRIPIFPRSRYIFSTMLATTLLLLWVSGASFGERFDVDVGDTCIKVIVDDVRIRRDVFLHVYFPAPNPTPTTGKFPPKAEEGLRFHDAFEVEKTEPFAFPQFEGEEEFEDPKLFGYIVSRTFHVLDEIFDPANPAHDEKSVGIFLKRDDDRSSDFEKVSGSKANASLQIVRGGKVPTGDPPDPDTCVKKSDQDIPGKLRAGEMEFTGAPRDGGSLNRHLNDGVDAEAYSKLIDLDNERDSFTKFKDKNGFLGDKGKLHNDVVSAVYVNAADLGFWRVMRMRKISKDHIAYYVHNFARAEDALAAAESEREGKGLKPPPIATVAMEYSRVEKGEGATDKPVTKFYIFDTGKFGSGTRIDDADLDGRNFRNTDPPVVRSVPGLCTVCHGGRTFSAGDKNADLGAQFIPFDLAAFGYEDKDGVRRKDQEDSSKKSNLGLLSFKKLNLAILDTNPTPAIKELICGWYWPNDKKAKDKCKPLKTVDPDDLDRKTQNDAFVPLGWHGKNNKQPLYEHVVKLSCRTCHLQRTDESLQFNTFKKFKDNVGSVPCAYGLVQDGKVELLNPDMPHSRWTYLNFWLNPAPVFNPEKKKVELWHQPAVLKELLGLQEMCTPRPKVVGIQGDMNGDGKVDDEDEEEFLKQVEKYEKKFKTRAAITYPHPLDLNRDGTISKDDADTKGFFKK